MLGLGLSIPRCAVRAGDALTREVAAILRKYGTDAHVYLPGIGVINGLTAGNYLDSAGTTAATVDNPVGLVLDAENSQLGSELVTNGTFTTDTTGWTTTAGSLTVESAKGKLQNSGAVSALSSIPITTVVGKTYKATVECQNITALGANRLYVGTTAGAFNLLSLSTANGDLTLQTLTGYFVATGTTSYVAISNRAITDAISYYDNVSVKEVTGIHALQATTANKPILRRGAVNLLTYSEQFDNAAWANSIAGTGTNTTRTANQALDPFGLTTTADRLQMTLNGGITTGDVVRLRQSVTTLAIQYTHSVYLRSTDGVSSYVIQMQEGSTTKSITVTGDWQRFTSTATLTAASNPFDIFIRGGQTPTNSNSVDILAWGAQLETGSTASAYIPTTTAAASSATGNYHWVHDSTDVLTATFPAGYESATIINTSETGQVTYTGQNIVGTYDMRGAVIGSELVVNGDFSSATGWGLTGGWGIASGVATNSGTIGNLSQDNLTVGKTYIITFDLIAVSNWVIVALGGAGNQSFNTIGRKTMVATAGAIQMLIGTQVGGHTATIDNVSVREITPKEYGRIIFKTAPSASDLAIMQRYANRLAGF